MRSNAQKTTGGAKRRLKGSFLGGKKMNKGIGMFLMNIAVACYLFCTGIVGFNDKWWKGNAEVWNVIKKALDNGDFANVVVVILSALAIVAGACILLRLFNIDLPLPIDMILIVLAIVWAVVIILADIIPLFDNSLFKEGLSISWFIPFSTHLMVLAGIALSTERFGG